MITNLNNTINSYTSSILENTILPLLHNQKKIILLISAASFGYLTYRITKPYCIRAWRYLHTKASKLYGIGTLIAATYQITNIIARDMMRPKQVTKDNQIPKATGDDEQPIGRYIKSSRQTRSFTVYELHDGTKIKIKGTEASIKRGKVSGKASVYYPNGDHEQGNFIDGLLDGEGERLKGQIQERGPFSKGKLNGIASRFFDGGDYEKGNFVDGLLDGEGERSQRHTMQKGRFAKGVFIQDESK